MYPHAAAQASEIILSDDDLRHLEKRFGKAVRHMGHWNSDGTFGYSSIPIATVEKAADALNNGSLSQCLQELTDTPDGTQRLMEILQQFGSPLIENIVTAYQQALTNPRARGAS